MGIHEGDGSKKPSSVFLLDAIASVLPKSYLLKKQQSGFLLHAALENAQLRQGLTVNFKVSN
jgi:hypothetical protein